MKKVLELIRVSTEGQAADDRASIPAQRAVNQRTCKQYDLKIIRTFEICDVSGTNVLLSSEVQEMLEVMKLPEIHGVVAREFSRLMRPENYTDYGLLQAFAETNTLLYLPEGPIDFASKTGRFMGTVRAAIAGMERMEILERVWAAKEEKRRRGELAQSPIVLPFGVGYDEGKFYYKPEAERVKQAFQAFLAGNQNYSQLAKMVGKSPRGMHLIMRNPIWTGWRVIDKKRDPATSGRYTGKNGRQADRRKIARQPEEVIRVRVIEEPLISEADFAAVQKLMDIKQATHRRSRSGKPRFTYSGFLTCSACDSLVYSSFQRDDYYICKNSRLQHTCKTRYMRRDRLEAILDQLFGMRLLDPEFISRCVQTVVDRRSANNAAGQIQRLTAQIHTLRRKRERVIETFLEGIINTADRDARLKAIDSDIQRSQDKLMQQEDPSGILDARVLVDYFAPLGEWEYWSPEDKRRMLSTLVPNIRVADYRVESLGLPAGLFVNKDTHRDTGSSPPSA